MNLAVFALIIACAVSAPAAYAQETERPFITTWRTSVPGESITIPVGNANGTYTVNWGDGTTTTHVGDAVHAYDEPGLYKVRISGDFTRIMLGSNSINAIKMQSIDQWGDTRWNTMEAAFQGAGRIELSATDTPDLSRVADMSNMFDGTRFRADISGWDVSSVTDMSGMFAGVYSVTSNISKWDVSNVTDMSGMFANSYEVITDISEWNVSSVTDMSGMFANTYEVESDISKWDVSSVTDMSRMFYNVYDPAVDLSKWNVSSVTDMSRMFYDAYDFNGNVSGWDVSSVTDMYRMFNHAYSFNQPLNSWDVSSVTDMSGMFYGAYYFNQPLNSWDVSSVTDMSGMFYKTSHFDQPLGSWDVSNVEKMWIMFSSPSQTPSTWYIVPSGSNGATIKAQNNFLDESDVTYYVASDRTQSCSFHIESSNMLKAYCRSEPPISQNITIEARDDNGYLLASREVQVTMENGMITSVRVPSTSIEGKIYQDANNNNMPDHDEGVAGVDVIVVSTADHSDVKRVTTGTDGSYSIEVRPGGYLVQVLGGGPDAYAYVDVPENSTLVRNLSY